MRRIALAVCVLLAGLAGAASAQEPGRADTLADIRQDLTVLHVELQRLKRELSTTGGAGNVAAGGSVIDRVSAIESEVQRLTAKTEELEHRIERVVRDGTDRLGELEFRLCELESDCDIAELDEGTTLGGAMPGDDTAPAGAAASEGAGDGSAQLAVGERADFDAAADALEAGEYADAAAGFARFREDYPGSPLAAEAGLKRGEALEAAGETSAAARAFLDTFSAAPKGPEAPKALYRLGRALGRLGKTEEACVTLAEVGYRFPDGQPARDARSEMQDLGCQ